VDDARAALTMVRLRVAIRAALALSLAVPLAAHVGSPDVFYSGKAGPYAVDVVISPPQVVPGIAEILVRTADRGVTQVTVRPVYWRAGSKGAPSADEAKPVAGAPGSYSGQLWLMAGGSYSVHVTVVGAAGHGTVIVPVGAVATGQLKLTRGLQWLLATLGLLLVAGVVTAVYAAVGESQVPPGDELPPSRRRRARIGAAIATPLVALLVFGGAKWWDAEARAYARTLYRPMRSEVALRDSNGIPTLVLRIVDTNWRDGRVSPLMPDHGKMSHLFLARVDSLGVFAHLHPVQPDFSTFTTTLPPLPAGRYRLYADVVHESGFQRTFVDSVILTDSLRSRGAAHLDRDDAWFLGPVSRLPTETKAALDDDVTLVWIGDTRPVAGRTGALRFSIAQASGEPVRVQSYLGMAGHAVVMRKDGGVYVHLHPMGTSAMASELAFVLRDRGDTTADGRLRLRDTEMPAPSEEPMHEISFPYAFPSAGAYRVWVQLRLSDSVRTAAFDVNVTPPAAR
jgi:hypothetical protein